MADRITPARLRALVAALNDLFGYPRDAYTRDAQGNITANAGVFVLDGAYGGWRLCQMCEGGGERDMTPRGSARATYDHITAFMRGAELMREAVKRTCEA